MFRFVFTLVMRVFCGAVASAMLTFPVLGQARTASPEGVVREFFQSQLAGRWLDAARMMDLEAFEATRKAAVEGARHFRPVPLTAEVFMQADPDMPRAVAEYQAKSANKDFTDEFLEREYARISSIDQLAALPVDEAAARWLEAKDVGWSTTLATKYAHARGRKLPACPPSDSAWRVTAKDLERHPAEIVGVARDKTDSVAFVLVRDRWRLRASSGLDRRPTNLELSPGMVTLVRTAGGWKVYPTFDLPSAEGMRGVHVSIQCEPEPPARPALIKN